MYALIDDVERAANAGAFRSALALALTIPDIGGHLAYPELTSTGERYRRWFDEYVKEYYPVEELQKALGIGWFDAQACYKLRCAYLHSGNSALADVNYISTLDFVIQKGENIYSGDKGAARIDIRTNRVFYTHVRLNIAKLCAALCAAGKYFCSNYKGNMSLEAFDIKIYDANEELPDPEDING